jgi:hypothetical protein
MNLRVLALSLFAVGCAQQNSTPEGELIENHGPSANQVKGLVREAEGPFVRGKVETLTAIIDGAHVRSVSWSATAGALSSRDTKVTWTLPELELAELTLTLHMDDGSEVVTPFSFALVTPERENPHVARSAREALLSTPMPVLDGGSSEISGGACDLAYDSTGANVHMAFTTGTHPTVYYARWNGSAWTIEVMDTLGFNTGGRINPAQVHLRLDGSNNPHIFYVRDDQAWYATKSGAAWTRERVDNATQYLAGNVSGFALNATGRPSVVYETYVSGYDRVIFATRMGPGNWTTVMPTWPIGTNYAGRVHGDLLFDAAGTAYFAGVFYGSTTSPSYQHFLASWNGTTAELKPVTLSGSTAPGWDLSSYKGSSAVWAGAGRPLFRTSAGVYDFTLASPLGNSTFTWSANEEGGAGVGDLAWNGRPVMLHHHGSNLELVTPASTGAAFWTWTQLGASSGVSSSLAVHPTTGVASICYQAGGRIMFQ